MKKIIALILVSLVAALAFTACSDGADSEKGTTAAQGGETKAENVYVEDSVLEFGYRRCYTSADFTGNVGIVDSDGNIIVKPNYSAVLPIAEGRFEVEKTIDNSIHSALIDDKENALIPFFKGEIRETGVIAPEGTPPILAVEPTFGKTRFVNTDGEQIIPLEFDGASIREYDGFFYGVILGENGTDSKHYIYDYNGKELCVLGNGEYADLRELEHGFTLLIGSTDNRIKFGVKDSSGKVIIPCKYEEITVIGSDRIVTFDGQIQSLIESDNVANLFDGSGKQLTKDGEFARIFFDDGDKIGIACRAADPQEGVTPEYWLIDTNGKAKSGKYDSIEKADGGKFTCVKNGRQETVEAA